MSFHSLQMSFFIRKWCVLPINRQDKRLFFFFSSLFTHNRRFSCTGEGWPNFFFFPLDTNTPHFYFSPHCANSSYSTSIAFPHLTAPIINLPQAGQGPSWSLSCLVRGDSSSHAGAPLARVRFVLLVAMSILFISIHHPMVNTLDLAPFLIIISIHHFNGECYWSCPVSYYYSPPFWWNFLMKLGGDIVHDEKTWMTLRILTLTLRIFVKVMPKLALLEGYLGNYSWYLNSVFTVFFRILSYGGIWKKN